MDPSRVIILSMFCNLPEYIEEKNAVEKTWGRDVAKAGFKQFFYSEADFNHAPGLVGNVLYVKSGSSRWSTYDKTMSALKYVQENFDYDVIVKTNMSTYVNIEILK